MKASNLKIVREPERLAMTQISRSTWRRLEKAGKAPKRIRFGQNIVGWTNHDIEAWIADHAAEREVL